MTQHRNFVQSRDAKVQQLVFAHRQPRLADAAQLLQLSAGARSLH